jgi:hypothetical protein
MRPGPRSARMMGERRVRVRLSGRMRFNGPKKRRGSVKRILHDSRMYAGMYKDRS